MSNLAVLASGTGSLFQAILDHGISVKLMVADRPCNALKIAEAAGVPHVLLSRDFGKGSSFDRDAYTKEMIGLFRDHDIDLVAMAGFMTVFAQSMFQRGVYQLRILNIHPSLLPSFKGRHAVKDAVAHGVKISGCTIHFTTEELDAGPILAQEPVVVLPGDTEESLHKRIKMVERTLYPSIIKILLG